MCSLPTLAENLSEIGKISLLIGIAEMVAPISSKGFQNYINNFN